MLPAALTATAHITRVPIDDSQCGNNAVSEDEREAIRRVDRKYQGFMYRVDVLCAHRPPKWMQQTPSGVAWRFYPIEAPVFTEPFDASKVFSHGVSFWRIPMEYASKLQLDKMIMDKSSMTTVCAKWTAMCFPAFHDPAFEDDGEDIDEISISRHFNPDAPLSDDTPWVARLESKAEGESASCLGLYHTYVTQGNRRVHEFWLGVQAGAPRASKELMDIVRESCSNDEPRLRMREFIKSSEAKFVVDAGYRTRARLLAQAWTILCKESGKWAEDEPIPCVYSDTTSIAWHARNDISCLLNDGESQEEEEEIEKILRPTINYNTHNVEIHYGQTKSETECIYYSDAFNALQVIEQSGNGDVIVMQTPRLGPVLLQCPLSSLQRSTPEEEDGRADWVRPWAFPASTGVSLKYYDHSYLFPPKDIRIPPSDILYTSDDVGVAFIDRVYFGFPILEQERIATCFYNHRITLVDYYRDREERTLNMRHFEERLGLPTSCRSSDLHPVICVLPTTPRVRIHLEAEKYK